MSNETSAQLLRTFHPLRRQHWAISSLNPWLAWVAPAAQIVRANRKAMGADHPLRQAEKIGSELISASLDFYRGIRDALSETAFFSIYANMFSLYMADKREAEEQALQMTIDPRELPFVKDAVASIAEGGYTEAFARVAFLLSRKGEPLPLSRLAGRRELAEAYAEYLPAIPPDQFRRIRGEQEIIARYEPEHALLTLPALLKDRADREKLITLLDKLMADERVQNAQPTEQQLAMLERIREVLGGKPAREPRLVTSRRA